MFATIFVFVFLLHLPLLRLPYFWDEAGYYIPAARDILLNKSLIPSTTTSNAHPPIVLAWIALWWKVVGYAPVVTRSAMLVLAAFSLLGVFRLAESVANIQVAVASTLCSAVYPVFFAQSSLAHLDLAAAGFTFWALSAYVERRRAATALWFALAALSKETSIITPIALAAWELAEFWVPKTWRQKLWRNPDPRISLSFQISKSSTLWLLAPVVPLGIWYAYHYSRTGFVFGNPEFFRYNVAETLNPLRFLLAFAMRLWQVTGYLHLWVLTLATLTAIIVLSPRHDSGYERKRISLPLQMVFYVPIASYAVAMALIGGAVLARYMLPVVPLLIIVSVSTLYRRLKYWKVAVALVAMAFALAWFWNPPYGFSPEDNLAYRDYVTLHEDAERILEARYPMARVLTAWPASDEITRPWLGYTTRPLSVVRVEDFSLDEIISAAKSQSTYNVALVFSTKYEPGSAFWDRFKTWTNLKSRFFGFHRDLPPAAIAEILGGNIVYSAQHKGQWIAIIQIDRAEEARTNPPDPDSDSVSVTTFQRRSTQHR